MFKLARFGAATLLGLLLAITLFVPGAFAQRVDARQGSVTLAANHTVATAVYTGVNQATHATTSQQAVQPLSANWRWHHYHSRWGGWGGGGWGGWGWRGWDGGWGGGWGGWGGGCGC